MNDDPNLEGIDWSKTTFEGAARENLRGWRRLTFDEKLRAVEDLEALGMEFINRRKTKGLPYIDPDTGELVPGTKPPASARVAETPPACRAHRPSNASSERIQPPKDATGSDDFKTRDRT